MRLIQSVPYVVPPTVIERFEQCHEVVRLNGTNTSLFSFQELKLWRTTYIGRWGWPFHMQRSAEWRTTVPSGYNVSRSPKCSNILGECAIPGRRRVCAVRFFTVGNRGRINSMVSCFVNGLVLSTDGAAWDMQAKLDTIAIDRLYMSDALADHSSCSWWGSTNTVTTISVVQVWKLWYFSHWRFHAVSSQLMINISDICVRSLWDRNLHI